jgi:6,7-dimethyl-8-ribityllumazine synthase
VRGDIDDSSENVLSEWSKRVEGAREDVSGDGSSEDAPAWGTTPPADGPELAAVRGVPDPDPDPLPDPDPVPGPDPDPVPDPAPEPEPGPPAGRLAPGEDVLAPEEEQEDDVSPPMTIELSHEHAAGDLDIPDGYAVLEGAADGGRRAVGVAVSRFNGQVTSRLLARALEELEAAGVRRDAITIMVVPGAFELPLAATALAKTRRFACVVALGCVIRGDTPHFDYVASEAASGLQLAALETGVPVSFGVLTLDRVEQADPRVEKGAEAVRSALEMADVFSQLRAAASR